MLIKPGSNAHLRANCLTLTYPYSDTVSPSWHHQQMCVSYRQQVITSRSSQCHIVSRWLMMSMSQSIVSRCSQVVMIDLTWICPSSVTKLLSCLLQVSVNNSNRLIYKCVINSCVSATKFVVNAYLSACWWSHVYQFALKRLVNKGGVLIYKMSDPPSHWVSICSGNWSTLMRIL